MEGFGKQMSSFRDWRSKYLDSAGRLLLKCGLSANILTTISLLSGLAAAYFLFQQQLWFIIFSLLHLLMDGLDGVVARLSTTTTYGKYYDHISDSIVTALLIFKIGWFFWDYYAYIVFLLVVLAHGIYYLSKQTLPIVYTRTLTIIMLCVYIPNVFFFSDWLLVLTYLCTGVSCAYTLALQLQQIITHRN